MKTVRTADEKDMLTVRILKAGKADAIIIQAGSETLILDTGEEDDGQKIVDYLKSRGSQKIKKMIITHFDKDHMGGADTLISHIPVEEILLPDYEGRGPEYKELLAEAETAGIPSSRLRKPAEFTCGSASVMVEPPLSYKIPSSGKEYDNNFSLAVTVVHGDNTLVFTADMEKQRISEWLDDKTERKCDFLKMPHHGIYNPALPRLLDCTRPKYAAICDSKKNPAEVKTLELLRTRGVTFFETKDGDITVTSDGHSLDVKQGK